MSVRRSAGAAIAALALCGCLGPAPRESRGGRAPHGDWLSAAQRELAVREYEASHNDEGLQAPNRAHNLRTYFGRTGIRVHDRSAADGPELLRLSLSGVGRGNDRAPVAPGDVAGDGARVEIRRPGMVEWYLNSPAGLEQGFTVAERPAGDGALVFELATGPASASLSANRVLFATSSGRKLAYGALVVHDAAGLELPAHFALAALDRVLITVDDASATYPIVVDPLLTETADTVIESNSGTASMGFNTVTGDLNGDGYDDLIVGAHQYDEGESDEGAVFVFLGSASGIASGSAAGAATKIQADQVGAQLGWSVGSGDVNGDGYADLFAGALSYDSGESNEGAAFVFLGGPSGIGTDTTVAFADTQLESNQANSQLYTTVSAGDVNRDGYGDLLVGSHLYTAGESSEGAVFIFHGSASGIASGALTTAPTQIQSNQVGALLGTGGASAGDVNGDGCDDVVVGAVMYDDAPFNNAGGAWLFLGSATGIASGGVSSAAAATFESDQTDAQMGFTVGTAGDVNGDGYSDLVVASPYWDDPDTQEGGVFVFHGSSTGIASSIVTAANTQIESGQFQGALGVRIAPGDVNGDGYSDLIASAPFYSNGQSFEGQTYVFLGSASGIITDGTPASSIVHIESNQADARFGYGLSSGDVNGDGYADVISSAVLYDNGETDEGATYIYLGGAQGVSNGNPVSAAARLESNQSNSELGLSVASAGDVNGDGYSDVIVGAQGYDAGEVHEGAAFVLLGSASGIANANPTTAAAQLESDQAGAFFGHSVASAGDVNGDGYADVIVGAGAFTAGQAAEGGAFVFLGSATGIADGDLGAAATQLESDQVNAMFGWSVDSAGDVNGDGYADVIVGAKLYDAGEADEGAAFVFLGSATGIANATVAAAHAQLESNQAGVLFGLSVASAGDTNGDGYADVIVGAPSYNAGQSGEGAAFVFHGGASGVSDANPATAAAQLESDQADAWLGYGVASAGDTNGDGYADVIVGATLFDAGQSDEGAAFVFTGSATGIADANAAAAAAQLESNQGTAFLGQSVASAGDVNGDGFADVIVGSHSYTAPETDEGAAFVFLGSATGVADGNPATAATRLESDQVNAQFGGGVAGAGDVNGDGYADVIAGARLYDAGETDEGAAFVFYGNGDGQGRPVLARQLRGGGSSTYVSPYGSSAHADEFQVRMRATHPMGRGRVKLQVQACPQSRPFGHAQCRQATSSAWTDVTASSAGVTLTQTIANLLGGPLYHWRARVLYAPFGVTQAGITAPPNPPHSPWRRLYATGGVGEIRGLLDTDDDNVANITDLDDDNDLLSDLDETNLYGTDPLDTDDDDDGLDDRAEVLVVITNPHDPDHDDDGRCDGGLTVSGTCTANDNCPAVANSGQTNSDSLGAGDACQCGDVNGDGIVNATDVLRARERIAGRTLTGAFDVTRCDVAPGDTCDLADIAVLRRHVAAATVSVNNSCDAYTGP